MAFAMLTRRRNWTHIAKIGTIFFLGFCMIKAVIAQDQTEIRVPIVKVQNTLICQGKLRKMTCLNESEVMVIYTALYGRTEVGRKICPKNLLIEKEDTNDNNTKCVFHDVKDKIQQICHKKKSCDVMVGKGLLGRPCKGVYKYLKVIYGCGVPFYVQISNETSSNTTSLPSNATSTIPTNTSNASCVTANTTGKPLTTSVPNTTTPFVVLKTEIRRRKPARRTNETSYVAVFVVAAICAAVLLGIVFGRCWYLRRRTKSQNFAVLHKPKRFFDPTKDYKQSNGHTARRTSRDHATEDLLPERQSAKSTELVITRADVESTQSSRPSRSEGESTPNRSKSGSGNNDEGDGGKGEGSTFYVNPMYDRNRQNSTGSATGSHPKISGHRLSNASEPGKPSITSPARSMGKQQMRCNSMGNIPRSHHSSMQRRHPSAGNVAANKDGFDPLTYPPKGQHHPQQQPSLLYNAPQIQPYQGQGQGNYQGQVQGSYQGQPRSMGTPGTPNRHGGFPVKSPVGQRPMGSPAKTPQRSRSMGPGGVPYQSPGPPGRSANRSASPNEFGMTEGTTAPKDIDSNTGRRYQSNATGEHPQWEVSPQSGISITINPSSNGPAHHRSNGRLHRRESWENMKPLDNIPIAEPMGHGEHMLGYGKAGGRDKSPMATQALLSPLDSTSAAAPNSFRSNEGRRSPRYFPAPPDQGSDSSDDDLYSLVAKGNYDSVINDPLNVRQTFRSENKKHRNPAGSKHTAGRTPGRMFSDTSV